jgi:glutamine amidotransferase
MISIIDYGMGNLHSVVNALNKLNIDCQITDNPQKILNSDGIILPGVGAFPQAIEYIKEKKLDKVINAAVKKQIPLLGICLGMQLLFEESDEFGSHQGLGYIKGNVSKLEIDYKIPQVGWNNLQITNESPILNGITEKDYVYFVHSFYATVTNKKNLNAYVDYGSKVAAIVSNENVYGFQFHPEKSGEVGLKLLKNFGELIK